ncbi:MAG TPA: S8 family serine peptidase [Puia sp.]|nr:S8 family serine peptidase [Puia sp.]
MGKNRRSLRCPLPVSHLLSTLLFVLLICSVTRAQVVTNKAALQQVSLQAAQKDAAMAQQLSFLAKQKGWPLKIMGRRGRIAVLRGVDGKGNPLYISTNDNIISAATIGTNQIQPGGSTGLNLNGSSASVKGKIAIWDEAKPRPTHVELTGRVTQKDNATSISDHSTHVSGTMIATGVNPLAKGMAFGEQQLLAYDYNNDNSEMAGAASSLLVSNHSYGSIAGWYYNSDASRWEFWGNYGDTADYKFGYYSSDAQAWDQIAYNAPQYLIVKAASNNRGETGPAVGQPYWRYNKAGIMASAGNRPSGISSNDGYDCIPTSGCAKNVLVVGAVNPIPGGYSSVSDVVMSDFSSWGPTDDGRIKPDVVADGVNVFSCIGTADNAYDTYSGTSMATPASTGSLLLLQEYYAKLHSGAFMRSATLKGIAIHTADEAGPADGPDFTFGWGLLNIKKAAALITSDTSVIRDQRIYESSLGNTASDSVFTLSVVASGKGPLVATISWTDPAGTPISETASNVLNNTTRMLVNDLDVRITSGSSKWLPYVLDAKNPGNAATTGDDALNNVEKIVVSNPVPGQAYIIKVTHKGTLTNTTQAYSLLISGVGGTAYCTSAATSTAGTRIDNVSFSNISQATTTPTCRSYTDYTSVTGQIQPNQTLPITVALSSCDATSASRIVKVFIDYNNDGVFETSELAAVSGVLTGGTTTYSGTITTPSSLTTGNFGLMRIVAEETTVPSAVTACGTYGNGETQDYTIKIVAPATDAGITQIVAPAGTICATDSQLVTIRVKNFGSAALKNVPITTIILNGSTTVATLTGVYPGTIPAYSDAVFTYQTGFNALSGTTYTFSSYTSLSGDQLPSDDTTTTTLVVNTNAGTPSGTAELCGTDKVYFKANASSSDAAFWYASATATTPIASGLDTSSSTITSDHTYYLSLNDAITKVGPANKLVFSSGGYNSYSYNFINFTNAVPVTIESARLYIGYPGTISFHVADISNFDTATGSYNISEISSTTINAYPTTPNPQSGAVTGNNASDTGAIFWLGLNVPTTGSHIIYIVSDTATIFRNNGITSSPYPFTIPGVFSITSNSAVSKASPTLYQQYYYFLYDVRIKMANCPSTRVPVVATTGTAPVITLSGKVLTSTAAASYQWYVNGTLIPGATGETDTAIVTGSYTVVATDTFGCSQASNVIKYASGSGGAISLAVYPNPSSGVFKVNFVINTADNVSVSLYNYLGQEVYVQNYGSFSGFFNNEISAGNLASGVYALKVLVGKKTYSQKVLIIR